MRAPNSISELDLELLRSFERHMYARVEPKVVESRSIAQRLHFKDGVDHGVRGISATEQQRFATENVGVWDGSSTLLTKVRNILGANLDPKTGSKI